MKRRFSFIVSISHLSALLLPATVSAITIDGFSTTHNDRFANDGAFVAADFDLSGVAFNDRWVTMLSPNVFISATHFAPPVGSSFTFYAGNDPDGASVTRTVSSTNTQIGDTDIWLGTLEGYLPSNYATYNYATETISSGPGGPNSFSNSPYFEANAYVFGRSPSSWPTSQNIAVGRNKLDQFFAGLTVDGETGDAIGAIVNEPSDPNHVQFEAQLQPGDSGGPLFVDHGSGTLTLVGISWFIGKNNQDQDLFGATYLGNYSDDINTWVATHTIPEPRFYALGFGLLALALTCFRRIRGGKSAKTNS
ncbi:MAG: hypothetical protein JJU20_03900 [Opitutales bacterium]|nr:hypothetical protein [Opitutales bacterium]